MRLLIKSIRDGVVEFIHREEISFDEVINRAEKMKHTAKRIYIKARDKESIKPRKTVYTEASLRNTFSLVTGISYDENNKQTVRDYKLWLTCADHFGLTM